MCPALAAVVEELRHFRIVDQIEQVVVRSETGVGDARRLRDVGVGPYGRGVDNQMAALHHLTRQIIIGVVSFRRVARNQRKGDSTLGQRILHGLRSPAGPEDQRLLRFGKPQSGSIAAIQRSTDQPPAVSDHEIDCGSVGKNPGADQIAFILAIGTFAFALDRFAFVEGGTFESITGRGIQFTFDDTTYWVGSRAFLDDFGAVLPDAARLALDKWESAGYSVVFFGRGAEVLVLFAISDRLKQTSAQAVAQLHEVGIEVHLLTGDAERPAKQIAGEAGIRHWKAQTLPSDKEEYIVALQQAGRRVAMVGDGINDSPALARADVSIAMGRGTDVAMDVAMVTLITSDLLSIPAAIRLSRQTVRSIHQNLFWAFIYNVIGIPLAAGILYPVCEWLMNPMIASAAMAFSSVSVVTNSLRLKWSHA